MSQIICPLCMVPIQDAWEEDLQLAVYCVSCSSIIKLTYKVSAYETWQRQEKRWVLLPFPLDTSE